MSLAAWKPHFLIVLHKQTFLYAKTWSVELQCQTLLISSHKTESSRNRSEKKMFGYRLPPEARSFSNRLIRFEPDHNVDSAMSNRHRPGMGHVYNCE